MKSNTFSSPESTQTSAIELKQNNTDLSAHACAFGGLAFLYLFIAIGFGVARNQWGIFPTVALIVGFGASVEAILKLHKRKFATVYRLFANRLEVDGLKIPHENIASIEWPEKSVNKKVNATIQVRFDDETDTLEKDHKPLETPPLFDLEITLNELAADERLLMIHYLQQIEVEHHDWDKFSGRYLENWTQRRSSKLFSKRISEALKRHPFWASFLFTPYLCAVCLAVVSHYVYWTIGFSIAISAFVNIRLMHGTWLSPIGETIIGFAGALILVGVVAACFPNARTQRRNDHSELTTGYLALAILALSMIFSPLAVQLFVMAGFRTLALITMQISPWLPCIPFAVRGYRKGKEKKDNFEEHVERANQQWETHLESFYNDPDPETDTLSENTEATKTLANMA